MDPIKSLEGEECSRRNFVAHVVEAAAAIPLVGLALSNFNKGRSYFQLDTSAAVLPEKPDRIGALAAQQQQYAAALASVDQAYYEAYRHSRLVPYMVSDGKTTSIQYRTEFYWREEASVPDHEVIDAWSRWNGRSGEKLQQLVSEPLVDIRRSAGKLRQPGRGQSRDSLCASL